MDRMTILVLLIGLLTLCRTTCGASHWSYKERATAPEYWGKEFKQCDNGFQSPINIKPAETQKDSNLMPVRMLNTTSYSVAKYDVINNGHSIQIDFPAKLWEVIFQENNRQKYCVKQMHFHWGKDKSCGSEHTLDGKQFSLEGHIVLYDCFTYGSFEEAAKSPFGLAVLGLWGEEQENVAEDETMFGKMGNFMRAISGPLPVDSSKNIEGFDLISVIKMANPGLYYRYVGSLTTPPCTPNVIWTVFTTVLPISFKQMAVLRKEPFGSNEPVDKMVDNFRPVQELSSARSLVPRVVYRAQSVSLLANGYIIFALSLYYSIMFEYRHFV